MKKVLFEFLDLKYSGKTIVMYSYGNKNEGWCQIYVVEDTEDSIMKISDYGYFTEFKVNSLLNEHILKYMNLSNTIIESYVLDWCRSNVKQ
jgi:hypothetical protein